MEWFEKLEQEGTHIPLLDTRPELYPDLIKYFEAFNALSSSRATSFSGAGHIPRSEARSYIIEELRILDFEEQQEFLHWIQVMDNEFVGFHSEKSKKKTRPKKPFTKPTGKR